MLVLVLVVGVGGKIVVSGAWRLALLLLFVEPTPDITLMAKSHKDAEKAHLTLVCFSQVKHAWLWKPNLPQQAHRQGARWQIQAPRSHGQVRQAVCQGTVTKGRHGLGQAHRGRNRSRHDQFAIVPVLHWPLRLSRCDSLVHAFDSLHLLGAAAV